MDKVIVFFDDNGKPFHIVESKSGRKGSYKPICGSPRILGWRPSKRHSCNVSGVAGKLTCPTCNAHAECYARGLPATPTNLADQEPPW